MQVVNKVLSKWNKKTELANHKISLNLQADISKVLDELEDSIDLLETGVDDLSDVSQKVKLAMDEYQETADGYERNASGAKSDISQAEGVKKKVEEIAKDLGVDPSGVKNYNLIDNYISTLEDLISDVPSVIKDFGNFK